MHQPASIDLKFSADRVHTAFYVIKNTAEQMFKYTTNNEKW